MTSTITYKKTISNMITCLITFLSSDILPLQLSALQTISRYLSNAEETKPIKVQSQGVVSHNNKENEIAHLTVQILKNSLSQLTDYEKYHCNMQEEGPKCNDNSLAYNSAYCAIELMFESIRTLNYLARSSLTSRNITESGGLIPLMKLLGLVEDLREDYLVSVLETIFQILESIRKQNESNYLVYQPSKNRRQLLRKYRLQDPFYVLNTKENMDILYNLATIFLQKGYRKKDKIARNDLFLILLKLSEHKQLTRLFCASGLLTLIITYSITADIGYPIEGSYHTFATNSEEDFEWKQLCWGVLLNLIRCSTIKKFDERSFVETSEMDPYLAHMLRKDELYRVLFMYVMDKEISSQAVKMWKGSQVIIFKKMSLSLILSTVTDFCESLIAMNGHSALLLFVQNKEQKSELVATALTVLIKICPFYQRDFAKLGIIDFCVQTFQDEFYSRIVRRKALSLCSQCCMDFSENKDYFYSIGGCQVITDYLNKNARVDFSNDDLPLSVIEAVRQCIIHSEQNEEYFILNEGIFRLLDILETAVRTLKVQIIGVLTELCTNTRAISCVLSWRGESKHVGIVSILLTLWKKEEVNAGLVSNKTIGVLQDRMMPLNDHGINEGDGSAPHFECPEDAKPDKKFKLDAASTSAFVRLKEALLAGKAIKGDDIFRALEEAVAGIDFRMKIYCLLQTIGFDTFEENLTLENQLSLVLVKEYANFKRAESWLSVKTKLLEEGNYPIYSDVLFMENELDKAYQIYLKAIDSQLKILEANKENNNKKEAEFFSSLLKQKDQDLQMLLLTKSSKTSTKSVVKASLEAKEKKEKMIKESLQHKETMELDN